MRLRNAERVTNGADKPNNIARPLVSILVPVFNVESYLTQCLSSICAQTLQNIEVICINDGSTDGSLEVIRHFADADARIVVIDKPNSGYGHSLNLGLQKAHGDYIGIVESDDFIDPQMFETLYQAAVEESAQIVKSDFYLTWTAPRAREEYFNAVPPTLAGRLVVPWRSYQVMQPQPSIWSALYEKHFLLDNGIDFLESPGASFQDTSFNYAAWSAADRVFLLGQAWLHYRQDNQGSSINDSTKVNAVAKEIERYFCWLDGFTGSGEASGDAHANAPENLAERKRQLRLIMQGIVYKTFRWNILRVAPPLRPGFFAYMCDYFTKASEQGLLLPEYFEFDFFDEAMLLVKDPDTYLKLIKASTPPFSRAKRLLYYLSHAGLKATLKRVAHA